MLKFSALLLGLIITAGGCGGDDATDAVQTPSEDALCESLIIDLTTRQEAERVLGQPTMRTTTADGTVLSYAYGDAPAQKLLVITFDTGDIFVSAETTNIPFPSCWGD